MEAVSLDSPTILTPISRTDIAQKKTSMPLSLDHKSRRQHREV